MKLNEEQQAIVREPIGATIKTLAGAGTGKTRVLVERYLKFVFEDGVSPDNLLALTFTKKAAAEMHGRVFDEVVKTNDKDVLRALYGAWIMNFHQFAYRVIKENAASFGIDPDVGVASEVDLARVRRRLQRRFAEGMIEGLPQDYDQDMPMPNRIDPYFDKCMKIIDKARGSLWTPESLVETVRAGDVPQYRRYVETVIALWRAYEDDLHSRMLLDFSDLIHIVVEQFTNNNGLRRQYSERFAHVLVDEFQDTSELQNELVRLLTGDGFPHVTIVGDEKQSIYRWRDARIENIREFSGEQRILGTNYRSTQGILNLASHVLAKDPYFAERTDEVYLTADRGRGEVPICVFHPQDESRRSSAEEARALGAWILALTGHGDSGVAALSHYGDNPPGLGFGDIAILMRTLKASSGLPDYEEEFKRLRIPFAIVGGVSRLDAHVLGLLKNLLRLQISPGDIRAFLGVVETVPFNIPDHAINELFLESARKFDLDATLSGENLARLSDPLITVRMETLREALDDMREKRSQLDIAAFITHVMEYTQFFYHLFSEGADLRVVDSISKRIFELIEQLIQRDEANIAAFLESVETLLDRKQFGEEDAPYVPEGRVVIMTQHQAKGLEFPAVAVPGIKKGPSGSTFFLVEGEGLYTTDAEDWGRGTKSIEAAEKAASDEEQEARCLLYVSMTRACDHLFVSAPDANGLKGKHESLFVSVLEAVRTRDIWHEEWRTTPPIEPAGRVDKMPSSADLSGWVDAWEMGNERIGDALAVTRPTPQGLQFVSWRGLHAFARCPLEYYYRYVAAIQDDLLGQAAEVRDDDEPSTDLVDKPPKGMSPEDYGGFVHRFLYEWLSGGEPTDESATRVLDGLTQRYRLSDSVRKRAANAAFELATELRDHMPWVSDDVDRLEWPVRTRVGNVVFHGIIDRVDQSKDKVRVIDYKVGQARQAYLYQIRFYAWILSRSRNVPVAEGFVAYLHKSPEAVGTDVSSDAVNRVGDTAQHLVDALGTGDYDAAPGVVCQDCQYREMCPYAVS